MKGFSLYGLRCPGACLGTVWVACGEYSAHELGIDPEAYDPKLDVDFTPLREQDLAAAGFGRAA